MALTKQTIVDKAETVKIKNYYCIQIRERIQILENGNEISATFHRYVLNPDHDVSKISDPVVIAQFNAVMTDEVKANYAKFVKEQAEQIKAS